MAENRVTTGGLETLHAGAADIRVSAGGLEVMHDGIALVLVTTVGLEVLRDIGARPEDQTTTAVVFA